MHVEVAESHLAVMLQRKLLLADLEVRIRFWCRGLLLSAAIYVC